MAARRHSTKAAVRDEKLVEQVTMPNGSPAWVHVFMNWNKERAAAKLAFANKTTLDIPILYTRSLTEGMKKAKSFLGQVYGRKF